MDPIYLKIPKTRVGALIGARGATKKAIQKKTSTKIEVDSSEGDVDIVPEGEEISSAHKAGEVVKAIGRGFSPENAMLLLEEPYFLEVVDLTEYVGKSEKALEQRRSRLIGTKGKAREELEQRTGCKISVYGKTVAIIGTEEGIVSARDAVKMLVEGASHTAAYEKLANEGRPEKFEL